MGKKTDNSIVIFSNRVEISESEENPDILLGKFIICDFESGKGGINLSRETIDDWLETLIDKPLVGKISTRSINGKLVTDFEGHNMKKTKKIDETTGEEYEEVEFLTDGFGVFRKIEIETIDNVEYIVATAKIWKRFKKAIEVIMKRVEEGTLCTSWEITVLEEMKTYKNGVINRLITKGNFLGLAMLGVDRVPRFDCSKLLEVAEVEQIENEIINSQYQNDLELTKALAQDMLELSENNNINENKNRGDISLKNEENNVVVKETVEVDTATATITTATATDIDTTTVNELDSTTVSSLTEWDLKRKLRDAISFKINEIYGGWIAYHFPVERKVWFEKYDRKSELSYVQFTYEVDENDNISVSEPIEVTLTVSMAEINTTIETLNSELGEKVNALVQANKIIQDKDASIIELSSYKEKFEIEEQEKIIAESNEKKKELREYAVSSGKIEISEFDKESDKYNAELCDYVDRLDTKSIDLIIAQRFMQSLKKEKVITSENIIVSEEKKTEKSDIFVSNLLSEDIDDDKASKVSSWLQRK